MFEFVYQLIIEFIGVLAWYLPILILFSFLSSLVRGGK